MFFDGFPSFGADDYDEDFGFVAPVDLCPACEREIDTPGHGPRLCVDCEFQRVRPYNFDVALNDAMTRWT